jgi:hypothetical protein
MHVMTMIRGEGAFSAANSTKVEIGWWVLANALLRSTSSLMVGVPDMLFGCVMTFCLIEMI